MQVRSLRRQLGIVPQEGFLFAASIRENIAFGRPDATLRGRHAAARAVGADDFIEALPEGYETSVAERGAALSIGQRQLIAFARALLADPRLLILDEATSSVDIASEAVIEEALARLLAGRTAFVIAHRLSTIRRADLIVVLEHGRVDRAGHARRAHGIARPLLLALRRLGRTGRLNDLAERPSSILEGIGAGSSKGRTAGSGPVNLGSNPSPAVSGTR